MEENGLEDKARDLLNDDKRHNPIAGANYKWNIFTNITFIQHQKWFNKIYNSKNVKIYLMHLKNLPIGQIRFDIFKNKILVDYSIDRFIRGKGYGNLIVKMGMKKIEKYKNTKIIEAVVKKNNSKSKKIFENLGFAKKVINNKIFKYTSV